MNRDEASKCTSLPTPSELPSGTADWLWPMLEGRIIIRSHDSCGRHGPAFCAHEMRYDAELVASTTGGSSNRSPDAPGSSSSVGCEGAEERAPRCAMRRNSYPLYVSREVTRTVCPTSVPPVPTAAAAGAVVEAIRLGGAAGTLTSTVCRRLHAPVSGERICSARASSCSHPRRDGGSRSMSASHRPSGGGRCVGGCGGSGSPSPAGVERASGGEGGPHPSRF